LKVLPKSVAQRGQVNRKAFNARIMLATLQLLQQLNSEIVKEAADFDECWRYLREVVRLLPKQLPSDVITIKADELFTARIGRFKAGLKLIHYLGFSDQPTGLTVTSSQLQELQGKWSQCEQGVQSQLHKSAVLKPQ
jgi:hypothetical protein